MENCKLSWQEGGNPSIQAVCPSSSFLPCPINDFSEQAQCHMNTFANTKVGSAGAVNKMIQDEHHRQVTELASYAHDESSHLNSDLDTY